MYFALYLNILPKETRNIFIRYLYNILKQIELTNSKCFIIFTWDEVRLLKRLLNDKVLTSFFGVPLVGSAVPVFRRLRRVRGC